MPDAYPTRATTLTRVREERYFDREAILGRDAASVFPNLAKQVRNSAGSARKTGANSRHVGVFITTGPGLGAADRDEKQDVVQS